MSVSMKRRHRTIKEFKKKFGKDWQEKYDHYTELLVSPRHDTLASVKTVVTEKGVEVHLESQVGN